MLNSQDIYSHLLNGGDKQALYDALTKEIAEAEVKIQTTLELEKKDKERREKKDKARTAAFNALKTYFALVNPDVTEDIIISILDTLETVEIKINGVRGKCDDKVCFTDEEVERIWNIMFPFNSKK